METKNIQVWKPTGGKDSRLDMHLNLGMYNGFPIYIHMTSEAGLAAIMQAGRINGAPNAARRGQAAKAGVYLNSSIQTFDPPTAHTLLFFEEDRYRNSSTHCVIFAFKEKVYPEEAPVTHGSWVKEIIYRGDIPFSKIEIIYNGKNPFVSLEKQNHGNA